MTLQSKEKEAFFTQNSLEIVSFLQKNFFLSKKKFLFYKKKYYVCGPMHPLYIMTLATCGFAPEPSVPLLARGFAPGSYQAHQSSLYHNPGCASVLYQFNYSFLLIFTLQLTKLKMC